MLTSLLPSRVRVRRLAVFVPVLLVSMAALGCGGDGTNRISGKITFMGKPVPAGKIYFTPDGSKGNKGPAGYATIVDGNYDTSSGMGAVKGPVIVAIEGVDPSTPGTPTKGDTSGEVTVKTLFPRWETTLDVTGGMTKDFDVPAEAAKGQPKGERTIVQP